MTTTYRGLHECPEAQRKQRLLRRPEAELSTQSAAELLVAELLASSASTQYAQGTNLRAPGAGRGGVGGAAGEDAGGGAGVPPDLAAEAGEQSGLLSLAGSLGAAALARQRRRMPSRKTRQQREFHFLESTHFIARRRLLETPFD